MSPIEVTPAFKHGRRWGFTVLPLLIIVTMLLSAFTPVPAAAAPAVKIVINGAVAQSDVAPIVQSQRVLVPLRVVSEYLGAVVGWDGKTQTVTVALKGTTISLRLGEKKATVNQTTVALDVAATAVKGRTMVPLRFIGQALSATVSWDQKTSRVIVRADGIVSQVTYDRRPNQATVTIAVDGGAAGLATAANGSRQLTLDITGAALGLPKNDYEYSDPSLTRVRAAQFIGPDSGVPQVTRLVFEFPEATAASVTANANRTAITISFGYKVTSVGLQTRGLEKVVVIGTTGPIDCTTSTLSNPDRAVIDLKGATISSALTQTAVAVNDETVSQLRVAQYSSSPAAVRVVLDLKEPIGLAVESGDNEAVGHFLATVGGVKYDKTATGGTLTVASSRAVGWNVTRLAYPNRLVIGLPNAVAGDLGANQSPNDGLLRKIGWTESSSASPTVQLTLESQSILDYEVTPSPDGKTLTFALSPAVLAGKLVAVDPGHGGPDPGALGATTQEKVVDLAISLYLRDALTAAGARVLMLRESDIDVGLYDRPAIANAAGVDLFISVHNNAEPFHKATGTEIYYTDTNPLSHYLADSVHAAVIGSLGTLDRGVRTESFVVIRETKAPSVLVEGLFLSTPADEKRLTDPSFQQALAQAICRGIQAFYQGAS